MAISGIKRKKIVVTFPAVAYYQLEKLAAQSKQSVPNYIRQMVLRHLLCLGLPIYAETEDETQP